MTTQEMTIEQIRDAWDALAPRYDDYTTPEDMEFGGQVLRSLDLGPGVRVLDVACGSGTLAIPAARRGADVTGADLAPTMIERLLARAGREGLSNVTGRVMRGEALDLPDDEFDVAVSQNGVSLFPDVVAGVREMARVTKPGGTVLLAAFGPPQQAEFLSFLLNALRATVPGFTPPPLDPPPPPMQLADPERFREVLAEAGLTEIRIEPVTWDMTFQSAQHFWNVATSGNPIVAHLTADLGDDQLAAAKDVIDGMLRERSGGEPGAVLHAAMRIGRGTV